MCGELKAERVFRSSVFTGASYSREKFDFAPSTPQTRIHQEYAPSPGNVPGPSHLDSSHPSGSNPHTLRVFIYSMYHLCPRHASPPCILHTPRIQTLGYQRLLKISTFSHIFELAITRDARPGSGWKLRGRHQHSALHSSVALSPALALPTPL